MATAGDLIKSAMRVIGVIGKSETPSTDEMQDGLQAMQMMLSSWAVKGLLVRAMVMDSYALTVGQAAYTVGLGIGTDFSTAVPLKINSAYARDSSGIDSPVGIWTMTEYGKLTDKSTARGRPVLLAYDPGNAQQATRQGIINVYRIPDVVYTLFFESLKFFTEFVAITDTYTFEGQYDEPIKYNLAIRIYREYHQHGKPIPTDILQLAKDSLGVVENLNSETPVSELDMPGIGGGTYNIYSDTY